MAAYDVTALDTPLEFDTGNADTKSVAKLPGLDRVLMAWYSASGVIYAQCFNVNPSTGAVTAIGSPLDIEDTAATTGLDVAVVAIDGSNAAAFFAGSAGDGYACLLSIDGTGNVTKNGSNTEYDTVDGESPAAVLWDSTHILNVWSGGSGDGFSAIFVFDTGAGTISVVGTPFEFDTGDYVFGSLAKLTSTKALVAYSGGSSDGFSRVLSVDNTTYAVTAAGAAFEFQDSTTIKGTAVIFAADQGSTIKAIIGAVRSVPAVTLYAVSIDTSTWTITLDEALAISDGTSERGVSLALVNATTLLVFSTTSSGNGSAASVDYDPSTGQLGSIISSVSLGAFSFVTTPPATMSQSRYVAGWKGTDGDGFVQTFNVELPAPAFTPSPMMHMMAASGGLM